MLNSFYNRHVVGHICAAASAFGAFNWVKGRLDESYAASGHPVDFATGQLAFDAALIESYYAHMIGGGTLDVYWQTQVIDFGFIAAVMAVSLLFGTLAARFADGSLRVGIWGRHLGLAAAVLGMAGAGFDAVENLVSFAMLANPQTIPQPLALAYSSAAAIKFGLLTLAMLALVASILAGAAARIAAIFAKNA